jgi:hypothetical protein
MKPLKIKYDNVLEIKLRVIKSSALKNWFIRKMEYEE